MCGNECCCTPTLKASLFCYQSPLTLSVRKPSVQLSQLLYNSKSSSSISHKWQVDRALIAAGQRHQLANRPRPPLLIDQTVAAPNLNARSVSQGRPCEVHTHGGVTP